MTSSSFLFCFHNKKENEIEADGTPISFLVSTVRLDSYEVVEEPLHGFLILCIANIYNIIISLYAIKSLHSTLF